MNDKTTIFEKVGPGKHYGPLWRTLLILSVVLVLSIALLIFAVIVLYTPDTPDVPPFLPGVDPDQTGDTQVIAPTYTRKEGVYNFLVIGKDRVGMNTDVIMVVNFDTGDGKINIVQIPRDTFFDLGTGYYKINAMYAYNYNKAHRAGSKNCSHDALKALVSQVEQNLCIDIDYYAMIDLGGFSTMVNAVGGVWIDIPSDMFYEDPEQDLYIDLKAGRQHLDGDKAEQFVRFRSGYIEGDLGRVNAQKLLISALFEQVKDNFSISTIAKLADTALKNVTTDIGLDDVVFFAKNALGADLSNINMMTMPGLDTRRYGDSGAWYYVLYREATLKVVNDYLNVYEEEITDDIFDRDTVLTDDSSEHLVEIYNSHGRADIYTADNPDVYIPVLPTSKDESEQVDVTTENTDGTEE